MLLYSWYHDQIDTDIETKIIKKNLKAKTKEKFLGTRDWPVTLANLTWARTRDVV